MTLREFLSRIWVSRWLVLLILLLVTGAAVAATMMAPRTYTASSRAYLWAEGDQQQGTISRQDLQTYTEVLSSPTVLGPLRQDLGVEPDAPLNVSASLSGSANILQIQAQADDPQLAAEAANTIPEVLAEAAPRFTSLLAGGTTVRSSLIKPATVPDRPTSPAVVRNILLGLLAGFVLGICAALLRAALDTRIRGVDDLEQEFDRPVLAEVPKMATGLDLDPDPIGPGSEAIRRLRTNVRFIDVTKESRSLVVSSPVAGDGKTTTAVNLARAMARDGRRVLLIDADLRSPDIGSLLNIDDAVGVTTLLLGDGRLTDLAQRWEDSTLFVLPAGPPPPNAAELLGSRAMRELFHEAQEAYDFVIIDSPPLLPVVDALLIERLAGNLLLVIAADRTKRRDVQAVRRSLDTVGTDLSGTVLNFAAAPAGYGYGYGYGERDRSKPKPRTRRTRGSRKSRRAG